MKIRNFNRKTDRADARRLWQEVGWVEKNTAKLVDFVTDAGIAKVAEIDDAVECMACSAPGTMQYLDKVLDFVCITGVTTGRVARKQGLAGKLTAEVIAENIEKGAEIIGLGMFEQGFYDQLGFGTVAYEHTFHLDPTNLNISKKPNIPKRITAEDWKIVHQNRISRMKSHGRCNFPNANLTRAEMEWTKDKGFGFGYFDKNGELTHHFWGHKKGDVYRVDWMAYRDWGEFLELMGLLRNLDDQYRLVILKEPKGMQLQNLLKKPFQFLKITKNSKLENKVSAAAWNQFRIADLEKCLAKTHLECDNFQFQLQLTDPIEKYLSNRVGWKGISGDYILSLGKNCSAKPGFNEKLPILECSINAFTRMWLGIVPASGLAITDDFKASELLTQKLDVAFRLPEFSSDWQF